MSPELLDPDQFGFKDSRPTEESDCYALGMVIFEVLSGQVPFELCQDRTVIWKVIRGERPERPEGAKGVWFTDDLWETLNLCWATRPENRPRIQVVFRCLNRASSAWKPPSPQMDGNSTIGEENSRSFTLSLVNDSYGLILVSIPY